MSNPFHLLQELRRRGFILEEHTADGVTVDGPENLTDAELDQAAEAIKPHKKWFAWILRTERTAGRKVQGVERGPIGPRYLFSKPDEIDDSDRSFFKFMTMAEAPKRKGPTT